VDSPEMNNSLSTDVLLIWCFDDDDDDEKKKPNGLFLVSFL